MQQVTASTKGFDPATCRSLYVGNLPAQLTEALLYEIFAAVGYVESVKIIKDKTTGASLGYGFVEFHDHETAARAIHQLEGCSVYGSNIKLNWAFAGQQKEDTSSHYHIFIGDLSPEINDQLLWDAFAPFGSLSDARVMWDQSSGRSRGYGFAAFRKQEDAEQAIRDMNGQWLGARAIRVNWATQKTAPKATTTNNSGLDYATVLMQTTPMNTTVYIGNIGPETTEQELRNIFARYGHIEELRIHGDKGYGFARYQSHEIAAAAIVGAHGTIVGQRAIRCSWGKEKIQVPGQTIQAPAPFPFGFPYPPPFPPPPFAGGAAGASTFPPPFFMPTPPGVGWPVYQ